jgi:hypothetical protein
METEHDARLDQACLDWVEREQAYDRWRDKFLPLATESPDTAVATVWPHLSLECVQAGMNVTKRPLAAHRTYLELCRASR